MPQPFDPAELGLDPASEPLRLLAAQEGITALRYRDGEPLVTEGEASQDLFLVLKGAFLVQQTAAPGAPPALLASVMVEEGQTAVVGEMAYLGSFLRTATVRSSGASFTLRLEPRHVDAVLEGFPELTRAICRQFAGRLRETNQALREFQARFALKADKRLVQPGDVLFRAGEPAWTLFQLVSGTVRLEQDGRSEVIGPDQLSQGFLEPGPFLREGVHEATATAEEMCFCAVLEAGDRVPFVRRHPELVLAIMKG